jgi:hypothetical protein
MSKFLSAEMFNGFPEAIQSWKTYITIKEREKTIITTRRYGRMLIMVVELTCTHAVEDIRIQSCLENFTTLHQERYHIACSIQYDICACTAHIITGLNYYIGCEEDEVS